MESRKALKDAYKQRVFRAGIFQVRNTVTNKCYLDCGVNLDACRNSQWAQLRFNSHPNAALQRDWNELGGDRFLFEELAVWQPKEGEAVDTAVQKKELKDLLVLYLEELQPYGDNGYH